MLRLKAEGIHEIERVRTQPRKQAIVDVVGNRRGTLGREAAVDEVPGEVLFDQSESEQVAKPGEHLDRLGIGDALERLGEGLPLQQFCVSKSRFDELVLVGVEERGRFGRRGLLRSAQAPRERSDHRLHSIRKQLALGCRVPHEPDRPGRRAEVSYRLHEFAKAGAIDGRVAHLPGDVAGQSARIRIPEFTGVVTQQALGDELKKHVVVSLEGHVDIEVGAQLGETVLGKESGAPARFPRLLDDLERVPGAERLQGRGEGLEIFAVGIGCPRAGEDTIESGEQLLVRKGHRVGRGQLR